MSEGSEEAREEPEIDETGALDDEGETRRDDPRDIHDRDDLRSTEDRDQDSW